MKKQTTPSGLRDMIVETAGDLRRLGMMDDATHEKITLHHLGKAATYELPPITGEKIRGLREKAHLSQAVFACYLNLTVGYLSQLERGAKQPSGPSLVLLDLIRRKGIETIL
jgi:putative transcriptional regulator